MENLLNRIEKEAGKYRSASEQALDHLQMAHAVLLEEYYGNDQHGFLTNLKSMINTLSINPCELELLNYEGPVLKLVKMTDNKFHMIDQWKEEHSLLNRSQVLAFVTGETQVIDSRGNKYRYPEHAAAAKPTCETLNNFIYEKNS